MFEHHMNLTEEQDAILNGSKGDTMAKGHGDHDPLWGALRRQVAGSGDKQIQSSGNVLRFESPGTVYDLMDQLIEAGALSKQPFSADPRPLDKNVPSSFLQNIVFNHFMYSKQDFYEGQLRKLGLMEKDALPAPVTWTGGQQAGAGEVLSWSSPRR